MPGYGFSASMALGVDPTAPAFYDTLVEDPEALGLPADFNDMSDEEPEDGDDTPAGEQHHAHVAAYRTNKEREAHMAALHGGVAVIQRHLDGTPGCTKLGSGEDFLHVRHLWADEADILAAPYEPYAAGRPSPPFTLGRGYPHCRLPWAGWPPVVGGGMNAWLFVWRIWRADRVVTNQIAAAGGLDDHCGWVFRPRLSDLADLAEWRRRLFLLPLERAAAGKTARTEKRRTAQRRRRTSESPPKAPKATRTITIEGDRAFVPLTKGYVATLPAGEVTLVEGFDWYVSACKGKAPVAMSTEYLPGGRKRCIRMHLVEGVIGPVEITPPAEN